MESKKIDVLGLNEEELIQKIKQLSLPAFIAKQLSDWLYKKHKTQVSDFKNISKKNQVVLDKAFNFTLLVTF